LSHARGSHAAGPQITESADEQDEQADDDPVASCEPGRSND